MRPHRLSLPILAMLVVIPFAGLPYAADAADRFEVARRLDISKVPSCFPVGFSLLTDWSRGRQYVAYYDADHQMTVAFRDLDSSTWSYQKLDSRVGWDSHNRITMALDRDGRIHLAGNMHCVPLIYFRTERPADPTSFVRVASMVGERESRATYPRFLNDARGRLIFTYRDGGSGNGARLFNVYDEKTGRWTRLIDGPLFDGLGLMNAYPSGPSLGPDGMFHVAWVWRDTPDCATNHDPGYLRSRDLVHWEDATGQPVELPVTIKTPGVTVDPIPAGAGLINGAVSVGFDSKKNVVYTYHKFDADGNTQAYAARFDPAARRWQSVRISDWDHRWEFGGGGSINFDIHLGAASPIEPGKLALPYWHRQYGRGRLVFDEATLKPLGVMPPVPSGMPSEIGKHDPHPDAAILQSQGASDLGGDGPDGTRYLLCWETRGRNRDRRPEGAPFEPSTLRMYELRKNSGGGGDREMGREGEE